MKKTQASGRTLAIAVQNALNELQLTKEQVEITVLQQGGLFRQFKVEVTEKPQQIPQEQPQPQIEQQQPAQPQAEVVAESTSNGVAVQEFLQTVLAKMGLNCSVDVTVAKDSVQLDISGEDTPCAIGYRGEVLDALQYLCSLQSSTETKHKRVVVDAEGYRTKREKTLQNLAKNLEQKVKRTGKAVNLEPMNPYERRVIHTSLQSSKFVTTSSEGQGVNRHVVISPIGQDNVLNAPNAPRKTLNFVYRSEKKRRR